MPFQILYDHQLADAGRYRTLVLAGCAAMSDQQLEQVRAYVDKGGRLCVVGPLATHDHWMRPRTKPGLDDLPDSRTLRVSENGDSLAAIRKACGTFSATVDAQPGLCAEYTAQEKRRLVHLVNYRPDELLRDVAVAVRIPQGRKVRSVRLVSPDHSDFPAIVPKIAGQSVSFTVPEVAVYTIAVIELQ
ncbi:MAG: hypothetical protein GX610_25520 [Rhodococcus sp.]|nr:hypothetical protein [Rhodococcus sp. (in: high G+C Gram-positive bacteria)]